MSLDEPYILGSCFEDINEQLHKDLGYRGIDDTVDDILLQRIYIALTKYIEEKKNG